jgi:Uma2 family endonuclease
MTSVAQGSISFTYDEYCLLPNDGKRYEIIDGELHVSPAPSPLHQTVSRRLQYALMTQLEQPGIALVFNAPCDLLFEHKTVVQPDLIVLRKARMNLVTKRAIEGRPDLLVEILSPSNRDYDQSLKRTAYAKYGVPEYWIADPEAGSVEMLRLQASGHALAQRFDRATTLRSLEFPEVAIPLAPVFGPL